MRTLSPLRASVGDVMWMDSATGEILSLDLSEEAWEEFYQASKWMTEEYGVRVHEVPREHFDILSQLFGEPPGGEAAYVSKLGAPGDIFIVEGKLARMRTLSLGHEFKHFLSYWSAGFPAGLDKTPRAYAEIDACRFVFTNKALLTPAEAGVFVDVFKTLFGLD